MESFIEPRPVIVRRYCLSLLLPFHLLQLLLLWDPGTGAFAAPLSPGYHYLVFSSARVEDTVDHIRTSASVCLSLQPFTGKVFDSRLDSVTCIATFPHES